MLCAFPGSRFPASNVHGCIQSRDMFREASTMSNAQGSMADVQPLLRVPDASSESFRRYFEGLRSRGVLPEHLSVRNCGSDTCTSGKGIFSQVDLEKDALILREKPLVTMQHAENKWHCLVCSHCLRFVGGLEAQLLHRLDRAKDGACRGSSSANGGNQVTCDEILLALKNGSKLLPHREEFPMPALIPCPGGCDEAQYCSQQCAQEAWEGYHSILCVSQVANPSKMIEFYAHADETNDIFNLAALVVAKTVLAATKYAKEGASDEEAVGRAWEPFSMGWKALWWESVGLPDDVPISEEEDFRNQLQKLAEDSLEMLRHALEEPAVRFPALFTLELWGNIIGMFELNNLDVSIPSPVEDYFLFIDELEEPERSKAMQITQPMLDALDKAYDEPCSGSAFYAVHSCLNHSCDPNTAALLPENDGEAQAIIQCLKPIAKGEELTISYIDLDAGWEERQEMLADYGFHCCCNRCQDEHPP
mmetsp:Transcript_4470/g.28487  ORF Transcript_4470/g.28487 Transcript_4470/m.28487 type:complete len:477 (-) Transcript_4470:337-1767(-)